MKEYLVRWEVELNARSPQHAAQLAAEMQRDKNSTAVVFDVCETSGAVTTVDLNTTERLWDRKRSRK